MRSARGAPPHAPGTASSAMRPGEASTTRYGPVPTRRTVPSVGLAAREMASAGCARTVSSGAYGCMSTMWTVRASAARTSLMTPGTPRNSAAHPAAGFDGSALRPRPKLATTSAAVNDAPSANFTPSRSQKVQVSPSFETAHLVASDGSTSVVPSRYATSVSKTWREMSGTAPSTALDGSSVDGTPATPTRNSFRVCAETGIIHSREKIGHASRIVMKKQARRIFDNDIALFLYVEPVVDANRFEANETLPVRYGTCSEGRQRVTARYGGDEPLRMVERRVSPRAETPPKDLTTLTFFFTAAYTRSAFETLERERRTRGQERRDGL